MGRAAAALLALALACLIGMELATGIVGGQTPEPLPTTEGGGPVPRLQVTPTCDALGEPPATPAPTPVLVVPVVPLVPIVVPSPTPTFYLGVGEFMPVLGEPGGVVELKTAAAPATMQLHIRGSGFEPRSTLRLAFGRARMGWQQLPEARASRLGTFDVDVTVDRPHQRGWYEVRATPARGKTPLAIALVRMPCDTSTRPSVTAETVCSAGAPARPTSIRITGRDFRSGGRSVVRGGDASVSLYADPLAGGARIDLGKAPIRSDGTFELEYGRVRPMAGAAYEVVASSDWDSDDIARTILDVGCADASVQLTPDCGPAGRPTARMDVEVRASGFTPGVDALVIWDPQGSHEAWPARVDERGRVMLTIKPLRRPEGSYLVRVVQDDELPIGTAVRFGTPGVERRVARASFQAPCRFFEETGRLRVQPRCTRPVLQGDGDRVIDYRVAGDGFRPGPLRVVFDQGGSAEELYDATADDAGAFVLDLRSAVRAEPVIDIAAEQSGSVEGSAAGFRVTARTRFRTPCEPVDPLPLEIMPSCAAPAVGVAAAYTIEVDGRGFYPDGHVYVSLVDAAAEHEALTDTDGAFSTVIVADGREPGEHEIRAVQRDGTRRRAEVASATGLLTVPCALVPKIEIDPASGPAGYATKVIGSGFPPDSQAVMTWDYGIEAGLEHVADVDAAGDFIAYVFVLPNDLAGRRTLSAVVRDQEGLYPEASADYLVVPGSGLPPGGEPGDIIDRR